MYFDMNGELTSLSEKLYRVKLLFITSKLSAVGFLLIDEALTETETVRGTTDQCIPCFLNKLFNNHLGRLLTVLSGTYVTCLIPDNSNAKTNDQGKTQSSRQMTERSVSFLHFTCFL